MGEEGSTANPTCSEQFSCLSCSRAQILLCSNGLDKHTKRSKAATQAAVLRKFFTCRGAFLAGRP